MDMDSSEIFAWRPGSVVWRFEQWCAYRDVHVLPACWTGTKNAAFFVVEKIHNRPPTSTGILKLFKVPAKDE